MIDEWCKAAKRAGAELPLLGREEMPDCSPSPLEPWRFRRIAARHNAAIIHTPYPYSVISGTVPSITTIHDILHLSYGRFKRDFAHALLKRNVRAAVCVVTVSEYARGAICEQFAVTPGRVHVVHHGVHAAPDLPELARSSAPYALYIGNAKPHKHVETLLRWSEALFPKLGLRLVAVVPGADQERLARATLSAGCAEIRAGLSELELAKQIRGAHLYVSLGEGEGFGLPPLEAAGLGVPSVLHDSGAHREVMRDGAVFCSLAQDSFESAVEEVLNRHGELRERAWMRAREMTWDRSWHTLWSVYGQYVDIRSIETC